VRQGGDVGGEGEHRHSTVGVTVVIRQGVVATIVVMAKLVVAAIVALTVAARVTEVFGMEKFVVAALVVVAEVFATLVQLQNGGGRHLWWRRWSSRRL